MKVKQSSKKGEEWEGGEWDSDSEVRNILHIFTGTLSVFIG